MAQNNKKQALGKGIRALLDNIDEELKGDGGLMPSVSGANQQVSRIPLTQISVNPKQPRKDFDAIALKELAESIKLHDIIQPVTVVKLSSGQYQLISGERRWRAAKLAGLIDIPAYVREANDQQQLVLSLLENLQRENLNAIEIGLSYQRLMDEGNYTQEQLATQVNKERSTIANYLRMLRLPPAIQAAVRDGSLSMGHARAILSLDEVDKQLYAFREAREKQLSVRQVETLVKNLQEERTASNSGKSNRLAPSFRKIQDNMSSHFSTKVVMKRKASGKGQIVIEFYNDEDLTRIMKQMKL